MHRYRVARRLTELRRDSRRGALGDLVVDRAKAHCQRAHRRYAIQADIVDVIALRTASAKRAKGPTVGFGQTEAVIWCAVADLLASHACKRELDLLPAGEVVLKRDTPSLGV